MTKHESEKLLGEIAERIRLVASERFLSNKWPDYVMCDINYYSLECHVMEY